MTDLNRQMHQMIADALEEYYPGVAIDHGHGFALVGRQQGDMITVNVMVLSTASAQGRPVTTSVFLDAAIPTAEQMAEAVHKGVARLKELAAEADAEPAPVRRPDPHAARLPGL